MPHIFYANSNSKTVRLTLTFFIVFACVFGLDTYRIIKLSRGNRALAEQVITIARRHSIVKQTLKEVIKEREVLKIEVRNLRNHIKELKGSD